MVKLCVGLDVMYARGGKATVRDVRKHRSSSGKC